MQVGGQSEALLLDSTHVKAQRCAAAGKGGHAQAIGRSRGGRTRKIHLAVDQFGRPRRLIVRPGYRGDAPMAVELLGQRPRASASPPAKPLIPTMLARMRMVLPCC